ncbi:MAG: phage major capsid protein [Novosphingobium sp.]
MDIEQPEAALDASFDIVARQDAADQALGALRSDIEEVKSQLGRAVRTARPALDACTQPSLEMKGFVDGYLRLGQTSELKSVTGAVAADGGYAVPREIDAMIAAQMKTISPVRGVAQIVQVGTAGYRKLITNSAANSGWVSETGARPETATSKFNEIVPPMGELYANPSASQAMLVDAAFDLEAWLADEIATEFARAEGAAFINGSGTNQPKGFLQQPTALTADATRAFGTLQHVVTGNATGFGTTPELVLIDLVHSLRAGHRQGAVFLMNTKTLAAVRKFKAADGTFLWQPGIYENAPARLLGYPVIEAEDMPDVAANALPIAFGNFKNGYIITERRETSILRDPYTNKPYVNFYATKRIGGQVLDSDAIKVLKIST